MKQVDPRAGFTLLEMLVVISVLGLLSMAIAHGLHIGSDGLSRARREIASDDRMRSGHRLLQGLIAGAYPAFAQASLDDRRIAFDGRAEALALVTRLPSAIGSPAMVAATLHLDDAAGRPALVLDWRLDLPGADGEAAAPATRTVIATGVARLSIDYFGPAEPESAPGWHETWTDRTTLPSLIRVAIQNDDASRSPWPPLVAAPLAGGNTACIYDPTDVECRRVR